MDWDQYQAWAVSKYTKDGSPKERMLAAFLGVCTEAGEFGDLAKKAIMHNQPTPNIKYAKESGDVLYYLAVALHFACIPLSQAVEANVAKLNARYPRGFDVSRAHMDGHTPIEETVSGSSERWPRSPGEDLPEVLT